MRRILSLTLALVLIITVIPIITLSSLGEDEERTIILHFSFEDPIFEKVKLFGRNFTRITIPGCERIEKSFFPRLPTKLVKILLPPYYKVKIVENASIPRLSLSSSTGVDYPLPVFQPYDIEVDVDDIRVYHQEIDFSTIEMSLAEFKIYNSEDRFVRVIDENTVTIVNSSDLFFNNLNIPLSDEFYGEVFDKLGFRNVPSMYPPTPYTYMGVYYKRGFPILLLYVHPMRYDMNNGTLYSYKNITLKIHLTRDEEWSPNKLYRGLDEDFDEISKVVDNPWVVDEYKLLDTEPSCESGGKMAIIASETLSESYHLNQLKHLHEIYQNIPCEIYYVPQDADPNSVRNLITNLYKTEGVDYVLLVGDDDYNWDNPIFRGPKPWCQALREAGYNLTCGEPLDADRCDYCGVPTYQLYFATYVGATLVAIWEDNSTKNNSCFLAGTMVLMGDGTYKPIEKVKVGDIVKALDTKTGRISNRRVTKVYHHNPDEMPGYYIVINDCLKVTPNHLLYTEKGWKYASQLNLGDKLSSGKGYVEIKSLKRVYERVPTYNLEVERDHTYLVKVSNDPIVAHNALEKSAVAAKKVNFTVVNLTDGEKNDNDLGGDVDQNKRHVESGYRKDNPAGALISPPDPNLDKEMHANVIKIGEWKDPYSSRGINLSNVVFLHTKWIVFSFPWTTASDLPYACLDGYAESIDPSEFHYAFIKDPTPELLKEAARKMSDQVSHSLFDDIFAEVYVGRLPVDNELELGYVVSKIKKYVQRSESDRSVLLLGEHLGFGGESEYGAYSMDELIGKCNKNGQTTTGIPKSNYTISRLYERDGKWNATTLLNRIFIEKPIFVNHLGHASEWTSMKFYVPVFYVNGEEIDYEQYLREYYPKMLKVLQPVESLANTEPFVVYSQGCLAGAFDWEECVAEHMLFMPGGPVAGVWNTMFGFGYSRSTDGPSQRYNREFVDAIFGEGREKIGEANIDSKEDNIGRMLLSSIPMRILYYGINLLGDPLIEIDSCRNEAQESSDSHLQEPNENEYVNDEGNIEDDHSLLPPSNYNDQENYNYSEGNPTYNEDPSKDTSQEEEDYSDLVTIDDNKTTNDFENNQANNATHPSNESSNHDIVRDEPQHKDKSKEENKHPENRRDRIIEWLREIIRELLEKLGKDSRFSRLLSKLILDS